MNMSDILEIAALCSLILAPLIYYFYDAIRKMLQALKYAVLPPRYLKKSGVLRGVNTAGVKVNHD